MSATVLVDRTALMRAAAGRVIALARAAITSHGRFDWALAGGSTPEALYRLLAEAEYVSHVDWSKVHFFWGDERCVPPNHPESNYGMAVRALLATVQPRPEQVHRMPGELEPALAAARYETELERHFGRRVGEGEPTFDLVLLGMGADGHTASLFPGSPGLDETRRWVIHNPIGSLGTTRLSLTLSVINAAAHVVFLVAGADKASRLAQVLSPESDPALPARRVRPRDGTLEWLVDAAAGAGLGAIS